MTENPVNLAVYHSVGIRVALPNEQEFQLIGKSCAGCRDFTGDSLRRRSSFKAYSATLRFASSDFVERLMSTHVK